MLDSGDNSQGRRTIWKSMNFKIQTKNLKFEKLECEMKMEWKERKRNEMKWRKVKEVENLKMNWINENKWKINEYNEK